MAKPPAVRRAAVETHTSVIRTGTLGEGEQGDGEHFREDGLPVAGESAGHRGHGPIRGARLAGEAGFVRRR